jgi:hypothetical protein
VGSSDDLNDLERMKVFTIARIGNPDRPAQTSYLETLKNTGIFLNFTSLP